MGCCHILQFAKHPQQAMTPSKATRSWILPLPSPWTAPCATTLDSTMCYNNAMKTPLPMGQLCSALEPAAASNCTILVIVHRHQQRHAGLTHPTASMATKRCCMLPIQHVQYVVHVHTPRPASPTRATRHSRYRHLPLSNCKHHSHAFVSATTTARHRPAPFIQHTTP
jgi:hypothetical protein